jgi:hypothetical protein
MMSGHSGGGVPGLAASKRLLAAQKKDGSTGAPSLKALVLYERSTSRMARASSSSPSRAF